MKTSLSCWRCNNALVIPLSGGFRVPCPACFYRRTKYEHLDIALLCLPQANYKHP